MLNQQLPDDSKDAVKKVRVLVAHNRYQQAGGEDNVVSAEVALLRSRGHEVELFEADNDSIVGSKEALKAAINCIYSRSAAKSIEQRIAHFKPDVVHIHNFFPQLSPSIHFACAKAGIPVVQTLHNYRLLCPGATFLREGNICEECLGRSVPWPAVKHGCYRQNRLASAVTASMLSIHRATGTWDRTVSRFIALTDFARNKFIQGGLPADRIVVKPNFVDPDPGMGAGDGNYALYVGRLSEEKGIRTLLSAWANLGSGLPLKIVGDGPMLSEVKHAASSASGIQVLGKQDKASVTHLMASATVLIVPSLCYEGFPLVIAEAFSLGLPVISSRSGSLEGLVRSGEIGLLFTPDSGSELAKAVRLFISDPSWLQGLKRNARLEFERRYTAEINYAMCLKTYASAMKYHRARMASNPTDEIVVVD